MNARSFDRHLDFWNSLRAFHAAPRGAEAGPDPRAAKAKAALRRLLRRASHGR